MRMPLFGCAAIASTFVLYPPLAQADRKLEPFANLCRAEPSETDSPMQCETAGQVLGFAANSSDFSRYSTEQLVDVIPLCRILAATTGIPDSAELKGGCFAKVTFGYPAIGFGQTKWAGFGDSLEQGKTEVKSEDGETTVLENLTVVVQAVSCDCFYFQDVPE